MYLYSRSPLQDEKEREAMARFACTGVYDFVEEDLSESESESQPKDNSCSFDEEDDDQSESESKENFDTSKEDISVEVDDEVDLEESMVWAPEKRFHVKPVARSQDRFKSFRKS